MKKKKKEDRYNRTEKNNMNKMNLNYKLSEDCCGIKRIVVGIIGNPCRRFFVNCAIDHVRPDI